MKHCLWVAAAIVALAMVNASAQAQSARGQEQSTKFGKGAQHPLTHALDKDDPLAKGNPSDYRKPHIPEKSKGPNENSVGNNKDTTKEHEFDVGSKKDKKPGPSGTDRPGKDKDQHEGVHGYDNVNQPPKQTPPGHASIFDTGLLEASASHGTAADDPSDLLLAAATFTTYEPGGLFGSVIGTDDRVRVTPTYGYPWRTMCKVRMQFPNGAQYVGSAVMVGPMHALTAGHCVYSAADGGWAQWMEVIPAFDYGWYKPYGSAWASYFRTYTGWTVYGSPDHDFSLITLDRRIGDTVGWQGYGYWDDLMWAWSYIGGYPADRDYGGDLYYHWGYVQYETSYRTFYQIDTFGGDSGAGVFWYPGGYGPYVHTVHAYGATTINGQPMNGGTRLDYSKFNSIQYWKAVDGG
ncbi:MAG: hypothetical protein HYR64_07875 [Fimbriimonas ginsengisoli]|uniref:Serine protease n=1 Tax=Fimbriimonas ginsengisoli TaxID=1005039 RepID=A0A931LVL9_FIMGI|nr:hypothetical protein [Fimbriimonas ginsengisoli]